jgi:hypothetical protein
MYDIYDILPFVALFLVACYWWRASEQKRIAVTGARAYCQERGLQLLDETLVFKYHRIEKESLPPLPPATTLPPQSGAPIRLRPHKHLCRVYEFDYSRDGQDRHTGEIILSGYRILRVILHSQVLEITNYQ